MRRLVVALFTIGILYGSKAAAQSKGLIAFEPFVGIDYGGDTDLTVSTPAQADKKATVPKEDVTTRIGLRTIIPITYSADLRARFTVGFRNEKTTEPSFNIINEKRTLYSAELAVRFWIGSQ